MSHTLLVKELTFFRVHLFQNNIDHTRRSYNDVYYKRNEYKRAGDEATAPLLKDYVYMLFDTLSYYVESHEEQISEGEIEDSKKEWRNSDPTTNNRSNNNKQQNNNNISSSLYALTYVSQVHGTTSRHAPNYLKQVLKRQLLSTTI